MSRMQEQVDALGKLGKAFKNPSDGHYSYPIENQEDLVRAIHAVGRGGADHDTIRRYVMRRAKELDLTHLIPNSWRPDGSLREDPDNEGDNQADGSSSGGDTSAKGVADGSGSLASAVPVAVGASQGGSGLVLTGAPIRYSTPYQVTDRHGAFQETMAPGVCGSDVLSQRVQFLYDHHGLVLARAPGTLRLWDSADALRCTATLDPESGAARDVYRAVARGDVTNMSVGFVVSRDEWNSDCTQRVVQRIGQLIDVSAVGSPASPTTWIRPEADAENTGRMRERARRDLRRIKERR